MVVGLNPVAVTSGITPVSNNEFLDIQANVECKFTLKRVRDMIIAYSRLVSYVFTVNIPKGKPFFTLIVILFQLVLP